MSGSELNHYKPNQSSTDSKMKSFKRPRSIDHEQPFTKLLKVSNDKTTLNQSKYDSKPDPKEIDIKKNDSIDNQEVIADKKPKKRKGKGIKSKAKVQAMKKIDERNKQLTIKAREYLKDWQTHSQGQQNAMDNTTSKWKFSKKIQSLLIENILDDKICPKDIFRLFLLYCPTIQGAAIVKLKDICKTARSKFKKQEEKSKELKETRETKESDKTETSSKVDGANSESNSPPEDKKEPIDQSSNEKVSVVVEIVDMEMLEAQAKRAKKILKILQANKPKK